MCSVEAGMSSVCAKNARRNKTKRKRKKKKKKKRVAYDAKASTKDIGNQKQPNPLCAGSIKSHTPSDRINGSPWYGRGGEMKANVAGIHKEQGRIALKHISYRGKTRDGS